MKVCDRNYTYDNAGQLKTALGYEADTTPRFNEQLGYTYDPAGNLNFRTNNAFVQTFNNNSLNELTTVTRTGTLTISGNTTAPATDVTVNGLIADRYADLTYARTNFPLVNGTTNFTAIAASSTGLWDTNTVTVDLLATHTFVYDLNGNLISDGKRGLDYDDENQMIRVIATNAFKKEFTYDGVNRLRARREFAWSGSAWVQTNETRFIYDGVLPIQHRDANDIPTLTLTRGLDLSGSFQGAGGVGGVLAVKAGSSAQCGTMANTMHFTCYDGNGNVTALMNAATDEESARYEYAPFAEKLRETGPMAKLNPIRFSTQYADDVTGDAKYLFRDYQTDVGRWLSRDPIDTDGGLNIYAFVGNNPMKYIDPDGRAPKNVQCGGVCGAIIDDWVADEIKAQKAGWDKWKKDNGGKATIGDYIKWANGNQRYKDSKFFVFNTGTSCGKKDKDAEVGCGISVTLCGKCVRSAILGNIMYGLVGNYAGFSDQDLKTASDWKRSVGMDVDKYDEEAYKLGEDVNGATDFCSKFNELLKKTPSALYEGRKDGGYNDLSSCRPCTEKTSAKNHGGNEKPRLTP